MPEKGKAVVKPLSQVARKYKQSRFDSLPRVPMRMLISGRSAAGKGTLISSLVLDHYRDVFECIYVFSSTVHMDPLWVQVTKYIRGELGQARKTNDVGSLEIAYAKFDEQAIRDIMDKSKRSLECQTQENKKHIRGSSIIFDDISHDAAMKKDQAGITAELFTTSRHYGLSLIASVHSANSLGSLARRQICTLIVFSIGNS